MENKTLSDQKAGKEGPVTDLIACSHLGVVLASRICVKGVKVIDNIHSLCQTLPKLSSVKHDVRIFMDRGYGKLSNLKEVGALGYNMSTVASTADSKHPLISHDIFENESRAMTAKKDLKKAAKINLIKPFVLCGNKMTGPQVILAKRQVEIEDRDTKKKTTLYGIAVRDCHDKKVAVKDLRFFATGLQALTNMDLWRATNKKGKIDSSYLSSLRMASVECQTVDHTLVGFCQPLIIGQRCGDWFTARKGRVTGTIASSLPSLDDSDDDETKQKLLDRF